MKYQIFNSIFLEIIKQETRFITIMEDDAIHKHFD